MFQPDLLKGKRALITGGGTGLGKSLARRYLELGAEVVICGRRKEVLEATAKELSSETGGKTSFHACDIRDAAAVDAMLSAIWTERPLDILVNNAAANFIARSEKLSPRAVDAVLNIVLHGSFYCTLGCGKRWIAGGAKGSVLSIVSTPAFHGLAFTVPSAAAKAGVLAMTRSLSVEWGPQGIRLVAVAPGLFPTPGAWERLYPSSIQTEPQENGIPLRRVGQHRELADLCSYLVSDGAAYITGECVVIDGGRWMQGVGGASTQILHKLTDAQWEEMRGKA